ncbi:MAG TPA: Hsp20 family protein [Rectinemataceae bacterium]|nr:Hsp20 family protein [Rectinemataceae bacterium]
MKTMYDSLFPVIRNTVGGVYRASPFELLDKLFDDEFFPAPARRPVVDVREEDHRYVIEAELPGLSEKDLKLELKDGLLSLSTAKQEEKKDEQADGRWLRRERREFSFERSFELPDDADTDKIDARFKDGLLVVEISKKPEAAPRQVPVRAA